MESVAIVGCGWFGLPLAKQFLQLGYEVRGTKRTTESANALQNLGIKGEKLDLNVDFGESDYNTLTSFLKTDYLVVNIPPNMRAGKVDYVQKLKRLCRLIENHTYKRIIFISTTGVYPPLDGKFDEDAATGHSMRASLLLEAEQLFIAYGMTCVIRFAGLVGPKRHPGRFFADKKDLAGADAVVNLVHLDDCIAAVLALIVTEHVATVYNLCAPEHPSRSLFYKTAAAHLQLTAPTFNSQSQGSKWVEADRITKDTHFIYQYPDPMNMLDAC